MYIFEKIENTEKAQHLFFPTKLLRYATLKLEN